MIRIGVLGAGHLGNIHLKLWQEVAGAELIGFYDHDPAVKASIGPKFGIKAFDSASALIDQVDAVDIVVPTLSHHHYAKQAIESGKHVFIEKPITHTVEEASELVELVKRAGLVGQVGHVERFNPAFQAVAARGINPMFIEGHRLAQYNPRGTDVSVVLDLMIHDLDIILHLVDADVQDIQASGVPVVSDTPDIANARIAFSNGCIANLTASRISMKNMRKLRFFQKDTYLSVDFLQKSAEYLHLHPLGQQPEAGIPLPIETQQGTRFLSIEQPEVAANNAIKEELTAFIAAIQGNQSVKVPFMDGFRALKTAHEILGKIDEGLNALPSPQIRD